MVKKALISIFITTKLGVGSSIFMPDSDTALLFDLVTTTAAQLNELERLVTNAQKLTGTVQKYNEIVIDHWYRAQRVTFLVEDLSTLASSKITNLAELNHSIRELKNNIDSLENIMVEYGILKIQSEKISKSADKDDLKISKEKKLADLQIRRAHMLQNVGNLHKVNTQINAYSNKHLVDLKNKLNQQIKILSRKNEIDFMEKERRAKKMLKKKKFYNMQSKERK